MSTIIDTLVTDRTREDVDELLTLLAAGINPAEDHKGGYNASDLNRVGEAIDYIRDRIRSIGMQWGPEDWETVEEIGNASGRIAEIDTEVSSPVKDLTVRIEPTQSGSGDPSPDNIRPISGWTGVNVDRTGKNVAPIFLPRRTNAGINYEESNGKIHMYGTTSSTSSYSAGHYDYATAPMFLPKGTYTVSAFGFTAIAGQRIYLRFNYQDGTYANITLTNSSRTITLTEDSKWYYWLTIGANATIDDYIELQIEAGSNATEFEPYRGNTYDIAFPAEAGTVCGGTLNVTNGVLTVTWIKYVPDASTNWYKSSSGHNGFYCYGSKRKDKNVWAVCNMAKQGGYTDQPWGMTNDRSLNISTDSEIVGTTVASWKSWLETHPLEFVYELETAEIYQLTPTEVKALAGENNVWADCGDVEVEYVARLVNRIRDAARQKTDWTAEDTPTEDQMEEYLSAVADIRREIREYRPAEELPESMRMLGFNGANQIESLLRAAEDVITKVMLSYRGYSGRLVSGVNALP